jgi:hypothetical protein
LVLQRFPMRGDHLIPAIPPFGRVYIELVTAVNQGQYALLNA